MAAELFFNKVSRLKSIVAPLLSLSFIVVFCGVNANVANSIILPKPAYEINGVCFMDAALGFSGEQALEEAFVAEHIRQYCQVLCGRITIQFNVSDVFTFPRLNAVIGEMTVYVAKAVDLNVVFPRLHAMDVLASDSALSGTALKVKLMHRPLGHAIRSLRSVRGHLCMPEDYCHWQAAVWEVINPDRQTSAGEKVCGTSRQDSLVCTVEQRRCHDSCGIWESDGLRHCFGPSADDCQFECDSVTKYSGCLEVDTENGTSIISEGQKCHKSCFGGCDGTSEFDCFACDQFTILWSDGRRQCVDNCPEDMYALKMKFCVSRRQCHGLKAISVSSPGSNPEQFLLNDSGDIKQCVTSCDFKQFSLNGSCIDCTTDLISSSPHLCATVLNSSIIIDSLSALPHQEYNYLNGTLIIALSRQLTEEIGTAELSKLRKSVGEVRVVRKLSVFRSYGLRDLSFLVDVTQIGIADAANSSTDVAVMIYGNVGLRRLFQPASKLTIHGKIVISNNRELCQETIDEFLARVDHDVNNVVLNDNGAEGRCRQRTVVEVLPTAVFPTRAALRMRYESHTFETESAAVYCRHLRRKEVVTSDEVKAVTYYLRELPPLGYLGDPDAWFADAADRADPRFTDLDHDPTAWTEYVLGDGFGRNRTTIDGVDYTEIAATIYDLAPFTKHVCFVEVFVRQTSTTAGIAVFKFLSAATFFRTRPTAASPVRGLSYIATLPLADEAPKLSVMFKPPLYQNGIVTHYRIEVVRDKEPLPNGKYCDRKKHVEKPIVDTPLSFSSNKDIREYYTEVVEFQIEKMLSVNPQGDYLDELSLYFSTKEGSALLKNISGKCISVRNRNPSLYFTDGMNTTLSSRFCSTVLARTHGITPKPPLSSTGLTTSGLLSSSTMTRSRKLLVSTLSLLPLTDLISKAPVSKGPNIKGRLQVRHHTIAPKGNNNAQITVKLSQQFEFNVPYIIFVSSCIEQNNDDTNSVPKMNVSYVCSDDYRYRNDWDDSVGMRNISVTAVNSILYPDADIVNTSRIFYKPIFYPQDEIVNMTRSDHQSGIVLFRNGSEMIGVEVHIPLQRVSGTLEAIQLNLTSTSASGTYQLCFDMNHFAVYRKPTATQRNRRHIDQGDGEYALKADVSGDDVFARVLFYAAIGERFQAVVRLRPLLNADPPISKRFSVDLSRHIVYPPEQSFFESALGVFTIVIMAVLTTVLVLYLLGFSYTMMKYKRNGYVNRRLMAFFLPQKVFDRASHSAAVKAGLSLHWLAPNDNYPTLSVQQLAHLELDRSCFDIVSKLGSGSFGIVYEGLCRFPEGWTEKLSERTLARDVAKAGGDVDAAVDSSSRPTSNSFSLVMRRGTASKKGKGKPERVAVKMPPSSSPSDRSAFLLEAFILDQMRTKHVVQILGIISQTEPLCFIMEFMLTDLRRFLLDHRPSDMQRVSHSKGTLSIGSRAAQTSLPMMKGGDSGAGGGSATPLQLKSRMISFDIDPTLELKLDDVGNDYKARLSGDEYRAPRQVSTSEVLQFACEIADGMSYLCDKRVVHRDLAARNCLISCDGVVKIADFGLARNVQESNYYHALGNRKLPVRWMAPESLADGVFTSASDVWSYGVVLWEIASYGDEPYNGKTMPQVVELVKQFKLMLSKPANCPDQLYNIMLSCWQLEPSNRVKFVDVVEQLQPYAKSTFYSGSHYEKRLLYPDVYINIEAPEGEVKVEHDYMTFIEDQTVEQSTVREDDDDGDDVLDDPCERTPLMQEGVASVEQSFQSGLPSATTAMGTKTTQPPAKGEDNSNSSGVSSTCRQSGSSPR